MATLNRVQRNTAFMLCALSIGVGARPDPAAVQGPSPAAGVSASASAINFPPTARDWAALARLPDWSGVWTPNFSDQDAQVTSNPPPWLPAIAAQVRRL